VIKRHRDVICFVFDSLQKLQEEAEKKAAEEALRIKAEEERAAEEAKVRMNYQITFLYKLTNLNAH
jgi:vacuolar-type H+-ATPase subunit E/Vma4